MYATIFARLAAHQKADLADDLIDILISRHEREDRPLRSCEPRDLIDRVRDICRLRGQPFTITHDLIDLAWNGYYSNDRNGHEVPDWP